LDSSADLKGSDIVPESSATRPFPAGRGMIPMVSQGDFSGSTIIFTSISFQDAGPAIHEDPGSGRKKEREISIGC
jgi:hypothetical protein